MNSGGVELPCTVSLHSQDIILKILAIILTNWVRSRVLGCLETWVLDGMGNSWIFHGLWLNSRDHPSTLESQNISGLNPLLLDVQKPHSWILLDSDDFGYHNMNSDYLLLIGFEYCLYGDCRNDRGTRYTVSILLAIHTIDLPYSTKAKEGWHLCEASLGSTVRAKK
jgi:hypothetical protein